MEEKIIIKGEKQQFTIFYYVIGFVGMVCVLIPFIDQMITPGYHNKSLMYKLLCASGKTGNLQNNDGVARLGCRKHLGLLALYLCVPVFVFHKDFLRSCRPQLPHLAVYVLLALVGGTSGIAVIHSNLSFWWRGFWPRLFSHTLIVKRRLETCLV